MTSDSYAQTDLTASTSTAKKPELTEGARVAISGKIYKVQRVRVDGTLVLKPVGKAS